MKTSGHGLDRAINMQKLGHGLGSALAKGWSKATCWDGCKAAYPKDRSNPAFGNCLVSVLLAWAEGGFVGHLVPCLAYEPGAERPVPHFQLKRGGVTIDPTAQQFAKGTRIQQLARDDLRFDLVVKEAFFAPKENERLRQRLAKLIERVAEIGGYEFETPLDADAIVDRAREDFTRSQLPVTHHVGDKLNR